MTMATIVMVPGAFVPATVFSAFIPTLKKNGIDCVVVDTPSAARRGALPAATLSDDADEVVRVVEGLIEQDKEVVLVMQSYGGVPGTQSLGSLSLKARQVAGRRGGVTKAVYIAAIALPEGLSTFDFLGENLPPSMIVKDDDDYIRWNKAVDDGTLTYSDVAHAEAVELAKNLLPQHSKLSFQEKLSYPGYNDVQVHYILCEDDKIIPKDGQMGMIDIIEKSSSQKVHVHLINAGHMPMVTRPEDTAKILQGILGA